MQTQPDGSADIVETIYLYDRDNRLLLSETAAGENASQKRFLYDNEGNQTLKEEVEKRGGSLLSTKTYWYYYNGNNQLFLVQGPNQDLTAYTYLHNAHKDVTKLTNELGKIVKEYSYAPYGSEEPEPVNLFGKNSTTGLWRQETGNIGNPFRYCDEYLDETTGLYYLRARDYDPETQRFLTEDTWQGELTNPLSLNRYSYCYNNPERYADKSGNIPVETLLDAASIGLSSAELAKDPSLKNAAYLAWDVAAAALPYVPGSYVVKGIKAVDKIDKASGAAKAAGKTGDNLKRGPKLKRADKGAGNGAIDIAKLNSKPLYRVMSESELKAVHKRLAHEWQHFRAIRAGMPP